MVVEVLLQLLQEQGALMAGTAVLATLSTLAWWVASGGRLKPVAFPVSLDDQSVEIEPGVRASKLAADGKFVEYIYEDARTTHESFIRGLRISNNGPCLGTRKPGTKIYEWISYQELYNRAQRFGSALLHLGSKPNDKTFIGIYSPNCVEWAVVEEACSMYSMVIVAVYDTLGAEACEFIINQTEMHVLICDKGSKAELLLSGASRTPCLKRIIVIQGETLSKEIIAAGLAQSVIVSSYDEVVKVGSENLRDPVPPTPETICTICYTSGTTGKSFRQCSLKPKKVCEQAKKRTPKGVVISHKAMIASGVGAVTHVGDYFALCPEDVHISYMPLAHVFERLNQLFVKQHGGQIGFSSGDVRLLLDEIAILRPTMLSTVPRMLNRIYDRIMLGVSSSWIKSTLLKLALQRKTALLQRGIVTNNTIWDWLVFGRVQKMLGGRIKKMIVGSAPISSDVLTLIRCAMGCYVFEAYGQTEVTGGITTTLPQDSTSGHVGAPLPSCHIKLVDIPDMGYYAKDGRGEVCIRSAAVMNCYYKEPEKTRETIDEEGWVHSGDIGEILPNGSLKLIDRKKHMFKLAQGEYVSPEKVESVYIRSPFVAQVFVDGDGLQTFPVAIVIPDEEYLLGWAKSTLGLAESMENLCKNKAIQECIMKDLIQKGNERGLNGFEQVKAIHLSTELFTVENDLITPSLKSKRPAVRKRYETIIKELYRTCNETP